MKLTESYLKNLIKQVINEVTMQDVPNPTTTSKMHQQPVDPKVIELLKTQGYEVEPVGNTGSYNVVHPTDKFKSFVLEPKFIK